MFGIDIERNMSDATKVGIWCVIGVLIFSIFGTAVMWSLQDATRRGQENKEQEQIQEQIQLAFQGEGGYTIFLDGEEIDWNKVDFDQYNVKIDLDKKVVYLH